MKIIDINAPIVPGVSIAGITIGMNFNHIKKFIDSNSEDTSFFGVISYSLLNGVIAVAIHKGSNKIFRVSAFNGYKGLLLNEYKIGMPIDSLLTSADWRFDEEQGGINSLIIPGVIACIELEDPEMNELYGKSIFEISVFSLDLDDLDDLWL